MNEMKFLILTDGQRDVIAKVNATMADRQLSPVPLPDGRWALNADVLDDPYTWGKHLAALAGVVSDGKDGSNGIEWQSANGKVEPVYAQDRLTVSVALADLGKTAVAADLDPAKDCYQMTGPDDTVTTVEIAGKYEAEKARLQNVEMLKAETLNVETLKG
jgi:hypothetical protein